MTQTILAIPINDMVSSSITAPSNQQQLQHQHQLLYHSSNNVRRKNVDRQLINETSLPQLTLPTNRYFQQHQTTSDDSTGINDAPNLVNNDNNNC